MKRRTALIIEPTKVIDLQFLILREIRDRNRLITETFRSDVARYDWIDYNYRVLVDTIRLLLDTAEENKIMGNCLMLEPIELIEYLRQDEISF